MNNIIDLVNGGDMSKKQIYEKPIADIMIYKNFYRDVVLSSGGPSSGGTTEYENPDPWEDDQYWG